MPTNIYRDLMRGFSGPPSLLAAQARDWVVGDPCRWRPTPSEPSDVLAVYGIIALTSALQRPAGWSGNAVHGPDDLVDLIRPLHLVGAGENRMRVVRGDDATVLTIEHRTSKLWMGRVDVQKIWETCRSALGKLATSQGFDDENLPIRPPIDMPFMEHRVSATGYDRRAVNVPIEDGFSRSAHDGGAIESVGTRPGIELYSLIGASVIEECGRWPRPSEPNIPALSTDYPLRDHFDLRAYTLVAPTMRVEWRIAGKRGYLVGC